MPREVFLSLAVLLVAFSGESPGEAPLNVQAPTTGGKQFWADELHFHKWRIQRNVLTGHCRLLDGHNVRHAWGSFEQCRARLGEIRREKNLPPMQGKAVVVLHGLIRSRETMTRLSRYLEEQGGYAVFNVSYPTTQRDIPSHARVLRRVVENLEGITEINFVAHSLGNIVVRYYLAGPPPHPPSAEEGSEKDSDQGRQPRLPDPRIHRFVMLGPPNNGSLAAEFFADNALFRAVAGRSGQQLGKQWEQLAARLVTPPCEFGILAGGRGDDQGFNPLLPGDDDGVVTVETTRLAGARDFALVPVIHSRIVGDRRAMLQTLQFLKYGYFVSEKDRRPIGDQPP